jgi:transcriptional regulator of acetoin/glycerol metabolism
LTAELLRLDNPSSSESIRISGEAAYALVRYDWPLNVRELRQGLARACAVCANGRLELEHFPPTIAGLSPRPAASQQLDDLSLSEIGLYEKLSAVLREKHGNVAAAARDMQKSPVQLYRWIGRFGIDLKKYRS